MNEKEKIELLRDSFPEALKNYDEQVRAMFNNEPERDIVDYEFVFESENGYPAGTLWVYDREGWATWYSFKDKTWRPEGWGEGTDVLETTKNVMETSKEILEEIGALTKNPDGSPRKITDKENYEFLEKYGFRISDILQ